MLGQILEEFGLRSDICIGLCAVQATSAVKRSSEITGPCGRSVGSLCKPSCFKQSRLLMPRVRDLRADGLAVRHCVRSAVVSHPRSRVRPGAFQQRLRRHESATVVPTAWLCGIAFVQLLCRIRVPEFDPVRSNSVCVAALFSDCCAWCGHSFVRMRPSHVRNIVWPLLLYVCVVRLPHCVSDSVAPRTTQDILRRRSDC